MYNPLVDGINILLKDYYKARLDRKPFDRSALVRAVKSLSKLGFKIVTEQDSSIILERVRDGFIHLVIVGRDGNESVFDFKVIGQQSLNLSE